MFDCAREGKVCSRNVADMGWAVLAYRETEGVKLANIFAVPFILLSAQRFAINGRGTGWMRRNEMQYFLADFITIEHCWMRCNAFLVGRK